MREFNFDDIEVGMLLLCHGSTPRETGVVEVVRKTKTQITVVPEFTKPEAIKRRSTRFNNRGWEVGGTVYHKARLESVDDAALDAARVETTRRIKVARLSSVQPVEWRMLSTEALISICNMLDAAAAEVREERESQR